MSAIPREEKTEALIAAIESATFIGGEDDFINWTAGPLQIILPHGIMACGLGVMKPTGHGIRRIIRRDFPLGYLEHFPQGQGDALTPVMRHVLRWDELWTSVATDRIGAELNLQADEGHHRQPQASNERDGTS